MSYLDQISKPKDRPIICTILSDAGLGKTSLAATFPKPIFIRAEDGLQTIDEATRPDALPLISDVSDLWGQLNDLIKLDHPYQTVVIDSVTAIERLFIQHVLENDPKKPSSINTANGGYGAGYAAVAVMHQRVRKAAGMLLDRGIHVVFIAHAESESIDLPDQDPYTRYSLRLNKKSIAPYTDDVDLVGFIKLQTFTKGGGDNQRAKAISDGTRVLVTYATASNVSKNRYGIEEDIIFEKNVNPFTPYVKSLQAKPTAKNTATPTIATTTETTPKESK